MRRIVRTTAAAVVVLGALAGYQRAQAVPANMLTSLMVETQGAAVSLAVEVAGHIMNASLPFSSSVDFGSNSFSFEDSGSPYLGQTLVVSGSATYDMGAGQYDVSLSGSLGGLNWSGTGTLAVNLLAIPRTDDFSIPPIPVFGYDLQVFSDLLPDGDSSYQIIYTKNGRVLAGTRGASFFQTSDAWTYVQFPARGFGLLSIGTSPADGGSGSFTADVFPTPEPAGLAVLAGGLLATLASARAGRRGR